MLVSKLKTKLTIGLLFLFIVIICFGGLGIFYVNRLSSDAGMILKDNHISLEYCNHMLKALDDLPANTSKISVFENNLELEEHNITEPGELQATNEVRLLFDQLKDNPGSFQDYKKIRQAIFRIVEVNQMAIINKNLVAANTASQATLWLTVIVSLLSVAAFAFVLNFPSVISKPVIALTEGIREIAEKNYSSRVHLDRKDEFGTLADTFNMMAEKLDEYEHSNLAEIKFEKRRIEAIIDKMNDGIIGLDVNNNILFLNSAAEKLFLLEENQVIGRYAPDLALRNDLLRAILQKDSKKQLIIAVDSKECYFEQESLVIKTDNVVGGEVIILKNVTPFKELDAAKTNFIATISHELKTPLFAIRMGSQLLEDERIGVLNEDQKELLQSIKANSDRLVRISGELLDLSQVETGHIQLKIDYIKPEIIVMRATQAVQQHAAQSDIGLTEDVEPGLPCLSIDEEKTTWVLINLLTNAIKYSEKGNKVRIGIAIVDNRVTFSVTDYGCGIEEKYLNRVFEKYFKVPGSGQKAGTGIGLSISREFIEAQGGNIWVQSQLGQETIFSFSFPTT